MVLRLMREGFYSGPGWPNLARKRYSQGTICIGTYGEPLMESLRQNRWLHIFGNNSTLLCMHYCDECACACKSLVDRPERDDIQMFAFCVNCQKYYHDDCIRMERCHVGIGIGCSERSVLKECSGFVRQMCGDCFSERRVSKCTNKAYSDSCNKDTTSCLKR